MRHREKYTFPFPCRSCGTMLTKPYTRAWAKNEASADAHAAHGLCRACYNRARRTRTPWDEVKFKPARRSHMTYPTPCKQCGRVMNGPRGSNTPGPHHGARGLCEACYFRMWRDGKHRKR